MSKVLLRDSNDITKPLAVTAADVGKVVGVDDEGNISLIEGGGSGGGDISIIHFSYNEQAEAWACDKTYEEINALLADDAVLCGVVVYDGKNNAWFPYEGTLYDSELSEEYLLFGTSPSYDSATNVVRWRFFSVTENNEVRYTVKSQGSV